MTEKRPSCTKKLVLSGLIVGSCAIAALTATGCDRDLGQQLTVPGSNAGTTIADLLGAADKPDAPAKLAANHNETFLVVDPA